jgi:ribose 5-phosphate isomerase A
MDIEKIKKAVGYRAAELVEDKMVIGIGSGSTVHYFIEHLAQRCERGLCIRAVASSNESARKAIERGIPLVSLEEVPQIDLTIDGADQIDREKRMIKGRGGAFFREKMLAMVSKEMLVIVDDSKLVPQLGHALLPVEVVPFGARIIQKILENVGYEGLFRKCEDGSNFVTDNGNYLIDVKLDSLCDYPEEDHHEIMQISGIVDTGFFFGLAGRVIVGYDEERVEILR